MEQMSFKHIFYVKTQAINFVDQIMNFVNSLLSVLLVDYESELHY